MVHESGGEAVSVTRRDTAPLAPGQKVPMIAGARARIVSDRTVAGAARDSLVPPGPRDIAPAPATAPEP